MEMNELLQNNTFEIVNGIWFSFDHFVRENYVTNGIYKIIGKQSNEKTRKREREKEKKAGGTCGGHRESGTLQGKIRTLDTCAIGCR